MLCPFFFLFARVHKKKHMPHRKIVFLCAKNRVVNHLYRITWDVVQCGKAMGYKDVWMLVVQKPQGPSHFHDYNWEIRVGKPPQYRKLVTISASTNNLTGRRRTKGSTAYIYVHGSQEGVDLFNGCWERNALKNNWTMCQ